MEIKRFNINDVQPGMLVADNVYNSINQLLVPRDAILTEKAIARMRFHSILSVKIYIGDDAPQPTPMSSDFAQRSYFEKLRETDEFVAFNSDFNKTVSTFEDKLRKMLKDDSQPDNEALVGSVKSLLDSCRTGIQLFDLLHCMRSYDDITFAHSINVALICAVLGTWLGYDRDAIKTLIECGIYHDVGKLLIPKNIVEKPAALTPEEFNLMKTHTMRGYNVLRTKDLDKHVKLGAMMHHERCNGSGYPLGIEADQIDDYAKILAIADVYEAMTSPRVYRKPKCPFDVIHIFETEGLALYDPKFLMTFMENITQSYVSNRVRLSDGTIGTIIYINKLAYSRPTIQTEAGEFIDLTKRQNLVIEAIL